MGRLIMRTNIEIDDKLITKAMKVGKIETKKAVVEKALQEFVSKRTRRNLLDLMGSDLLAPDYDYKASRQNRF